MMFLPDPVKQRHQAVGEQVKKVPQRRILCTDPFHEQLRVVPREDSEEPGQSHERLRHVNRPLFILAFCNLVNRARGKAEGEMGPKAHDFVARGLVPANRPSVGKYAFEQAHGLKEIKPIALLE